MCRKNIKIRKIKSVGKNIDILFPQKKKAGRRMCVEDAMRWEERGGGHFLLEVFYHNNRTDCSNFVFQHFIIIRHFKEPFHGYC